MKAGKCIFAVFRYVCVASNKLSRQSSVYRFFDFVRSFISIECSILKKTCDDRPLNKSQMTDSDKSINFVLVDNNDSTE